MACVSLTPLSSHTSVLRVDQEEAHVSLGSEVASQIATNILFASPPTPLSQESKCKGSWNIESLTKDSVIPCPPLIIEELNFLHRELDTWKWQTQVACCTTTINAIFSGVSGALEWNWKIGGITSLLSCASSTMSFFYSKAQSDYRSEIDSKQASLVEKIKKIYSGLGRQLIDEYISNTPHQCLSRNDAVTEGEVKQGLRPIGTDRRKARGASQNILAVVNLLYKNWDNIKIALIKMKFNPDKAGFILSPLQAAVAIIKIERAGSNQAEMLEKGSSEDFDLMETHFHSKRSEQLPALIKEDKEHTERQHKKELQKLLDESSATNQKILEASLSAQIANQRAENLEKELALLKEKMNALTSPILVEVSLNRNEKEKQSQEVQSRQHSREVAGLQLPAKLPAKSVLQNNNKRVSTQLHKLLSTRNTASGFGVKDLRMTSRNLAQRHLYVDPSKKRIPKPFPLQQPTPYDPSTSETKSSLRTRPLSEVKKSPSTSVSSSRASISNNPIKKKSI